MVYTDLYCYALTMALAGFTWINFLVDADGIFDFVPEWLKDIMDAMGVNSWWTDKIMFVFTYCEKCFSGQLAFWCFFTYDFEGAMSMQHIFTTVLSVFFAGIINKVWGKYLM